MSQIREQLLEFFDCMPESEQILLLEIAKRFIPDDVLTPTEHRELEEAKRSIREEGTVSHAEINWD